MPRALITTRISQEQFAEIEQLVSDGIFASRSEVLQTFVELGLEHCNLEEDKTVFAEYKAKAIVATQRIGICNLAKSIIEELSCFIELHHVYSIIDSLVNIEDLAMQLSSDTYQKLMEVLNLEPIYQVAQRMAKGE